MPNRILNSVNMLYTPNIEDVKKYNNYASPNTFVVSSYLNSGTYFGCEYYKGLSYELYYIDNDKNIQQLTYNIVQGNGLSIKDNKLEIQLDNNTLKIKEYPNLTQKYYVYVDTTPFKEASYLNRGLLSIQNDIYYNDKYSDTFTGKGAVAFNNNQIVLSNGLKHDLQNIKKYYDKCNNIIKRITTLYKICIKDLDIPTFVNVGDILYYNSEKKKYTFDRINKSGSINTPAMVCIIASNVLEDGNPRFMPLKRKMDKYTFDDTNIMYVKNALNTIPIYSTNELDQINISTNTISSDKGYIAVKRDEWENNVHNPLNEEENYFVLNDKTLISSVLTEEYLSNQIVDWYLDEQKIDPNNNYRIAPDGIFTEIIHPSIQEQINDESIYMIISLSFDNNITKWYLCDLKLKDNRLVNNSYIYSYNLKKTITNNFSKVSLNTEEGFKSLINEDSTQGKIQFKELEDINFEKFSTDEKIYVVTDNPKMLTDTTISISEVYNNQGDNVVVFEVKTSQKGTVILSTTSGYLAHTNMIINIPNYNYINQITNNSSEPITTTINALFSPDDSNQYKSSSTSLQITIGAK